MTGHNHLMSNAYVFAYQAEIKDAMGSARLTGGRLRGAYGRAAARLVKTRARITEANRSRVGPAGVRSFDRSSSTGACEVSDGLAV